MKFGKLLWMFNSSKVRASKWGKKYKVKTIIIQKEEEAKFLYKLASKYANYNIVELGRKYGGSAVVMGSALRREGGTGRIYSVDLSEDHYEFSKEFIRDMGCLDYVELIKSNSQVYPLDYEINDVAFVLFDATHDYDIMKEFNVWYDRIMPNGYMIIHDYGMEKHEGVTRAVDDFVVQHGLKISDKVGRIAVIRKLK